MAAANEDPIGNVYLMSGKSFAPRGFWKIGYTQQKMTGRLETYKRSMPSENMVILRTIESSDPVELKRRCDEMLDRLQLSHTKQWVKSTWKKINHIIDIIVENMEREIEMANELHD